MATSREKDRHKKPKRAEISRLQLSDLPDEILIRILSLLPTRDSVATCLLSRRWLYLWTSITKLEFCENHFGQDQRSQFMDFVDSVMILHDRFSLASFSLSCEVSSDAPRINRWITSAIRCNIKDLSLNLTDWYSLTYGTYSYRLPFSIFNCQSLVKLELISIYFQFLGVPSSICLPNLKYLELRDVTFDNSECTRKLLSHASLEELHIRGCDWGNVVFLTVSVPKLRVLTVFYDDYSAYSQEDVDFDRRVWFSGDNVEYFTFKGLPMCQYHVSAHAMMKAEILVQYVDPVEENMDIMAERCHALLRGLSGVLDLTLTEEFLKVFEQEQELVDTKVPLFRRMTQLTLETNEADDSLVRIDSLMLMKIYDNSPNLEHLNVMQVMSNCVRGLILHPMPSCFRTHLKRITIVNYVADKQENALEVLLNSAPVLEKLVLRYTVANLCNEDESEALEAELNRRPKASKNCRISVVFDY